MKAATLSIEEMTDLLKRKVTCEVERLLRAMTRGYSLDLQFILEEIYLIDMLSRDFSEDNLSLYALEYYINNEYDSRTVGY